MFNNKGNKNYWQSYSDLLISLLVVFIVIAIVSWNEYRVKKKEYEEIEEIKTAFQNLNPDYFSYNEEYQKHILKIDVEFPTGEFNIIDKALIIELNAVKQHLVMTMDSINNINSNIRYLLIIEGQASKDGYYIDEYHNNDVLSYQRALALKNLWFNNGADLESVLENCEVIIAGSGEAGYPREIKENKNQRFLIQIIPKIDKI